MANNYCYIYLYLSQAIIAITFATLTDLNILFALAINVLISMLLYIISRKTKRKQGCKSVKQFAERLSNAYRENRIKKDDECNQICQMINSNLKTAKIEDCKTVMVNKDCADDFDFYMITNDASIDFDKLHTNLKTSLVKTIDDVFTDKITLINKILIIDREIKEFELLVVTKDHNKLVTKNYKLRIITENEANIIQLAGQKEDKDFKDLHSEVLLFFSYLYEKAGLMKCDGNVSEDDIMNILKLSHNRNELEQLTEYQGSSEKKVGIINKSNLSLMIGKFLLNKLQDTGNENEFCALLEQVLIFMNEILDKNSGKITFADEEMNQATDIQLCSSKLKNFVTKLNNELINELNNNCNLLKLIKLSRKSQQPNGSFRLPCNEFLTFFTKILLPIGILTLVAYAIKETQIFDSNCTKTIEIFGFNVKTCQLNKIVDVEDHIEDQTIDDNDIETELNDIEKEKSESKLENSEEMQKFFDSLDNDEMFQKMLLEILKEVGNSSEGEDLSFLKAMLGGNEGGDKLNDGIENLAKVFDESLAANVEANKIDLDDIKDNESEQNIESEDKQTDNDQKTTSENLPTIDEIDNNSQDRKVEL